MKGLIVCLYLALCGISLNMLDDRDRDDDKEIGHKSNQRKHLSAPKIPAYTSQSTNIETDTTTPNSQIDPAINLSASPTLFHASPELQATPEFQYNLKKTQELQSKVNFQVGPTKFFSMMPEEFRSKLTLKVSPQNCQLKLKSTGSNVVLKATSYDWRTTIKNWPVKDQGDCGCCWAFATVAHLEALNFKKTKTMTTMSEQYLVNCDTNDFACDGGAMDTALSWLIKSGGMVKSSVVPWVGVKKACAKNSNSKPAVVVTKSVIYNSSNEDDIANLLVSVGPLTIGINANMFQSYIGGIMDYTDKECTQTGLNHAVVIVGYGEENGKKYWTIRNSWGKDWGEGGYIRVARGNGTCGVNRYVVYGAIK